ncbi:hypothetical protein [Saccharothrix deserti]|uniref:hypothetical protein n=1 Tax=Saccharothrix deserti TaxID=2593674 RepID=UPI00131CB63D|nr:hypothetical protein [Saccharothrix deserti]
MKSLTADPAGVGRRAAHDVAAFTTDRPPAGGVGPVRTAFAAGAGPLARIAARQVGASAARPGEVVGSGLLRRRHAAGRA